MKNNQRVSQRSMRLGIIWGVWTLFGIFFATQMYFDPRPVPLLKSLVWQLTAAYALALATPPVLWLAGRFPIERHNWVRRLLLHLLFSVVFSTILGSFHVTNDLLHMGSEVSLIKVLRLAFVRLFDKELEIYWAIVFISHAFNYYHRYLKGELKASQLETQLAQSQLQALKMQLHPHFLFNTLNAISELVHQDPEVAEEMIANLSDLLRLSLDRVGVQEIPLKQELEFLKKYLEIEQTRFGKRLSVRMKINPGTLDACVPNMILQPLVENAVRHAIALRASGGHIEISSARQDGMLHLDVSDNGRGLPEHAKKFETKSGIGLTNTQRRLEGLYGAGKHRFELLNQPGQGLTVRIAIPFHESEIDFEHQQDSGTDR